MASQGVLRRRFFVRWLFMLGGLLFLSGLVTLIAAYITVKIPNPNDFSTGQATIIQYSDGSEIGRLGAQNRVSVPLARIPLQVRQAVMSAENRSFYTDHAIDPLGIMRALYHDLRGGSLQGGSTITQQYAKTAFLTSARTPTRKLKELIISIKLENELSKDQILEDYLNTIWFGRGAYGIESASQQYFGTDVDQLTLEQGAVLAAILRAPAYYDPSVASGNQARLVARFEYVIQGMVKSGWITPARAAQAKMPVLKDPTTSGTYGGPRGFLLMTAKSELSKLGFTEDQILVSGLRVRTTFQRQAQQAAEAAVARFRPKPAPSDLHIGLASVTPGTGAVVAMYGGPDYLKRQFNDATQSISQAGSTFKTFALIGALEAGIGLNTKWNGKSPQTFNVNGKPYVVGNYAKESFGTVSLLTATADSINTVYVPLGMQVGPDKIVEIARQAGIPDSVALMPTPSIVLGAASPHVIDVADAFATYAAQGIYAKPYFIQSVHGNNGGVLYQAKPQGQQVFSKDVMADLSYALKYVVDYGSGFEAKKLKRPAAGKTGTSDNNATAWFSGYTPQLATSVALFRNSPSENLHGIGGLSSVFGGSFPAQIWTAYMKGALKGQPVLQFPPPVHISGTLPTPVPVFKKGVPTTMPIPGTSPTPTPTPTPTDTTLTPTPTPTPTDTTPPPAPPPATATPAATP
ncbi:MAG TPA: transglycosylase domain-containing protein [Candidatus Nanopelagicaceae bacterium]|nr:transglycosylase domain-containing protein [Candidatus Nanopelagicaceae bacterium]